MPISRFFDPLSVTPYNQQWNFSIEHEFPGQIVLSTAYVGSKGTHLWLNREINPAVFIPGNGPDGKPLSTAGYSTRLQPSRIVPRPNYPPRVLS